MNPNAEVLHKSSTSANGTATASQHGQSKESKQLQMYKLYWFNKKSRILNGGTVLYKAIFYENIPFHRPYIGLIHGRYLQFRFLKWPLIVETSWNITHLWTWYQPTNLWQWIWESCSRSRTVQYTHWCGNTMWYDYDILLVGGFNPSEEY